jgi:hypothetical protein
MTTSGTFHAAVAKQCVKLVATYLTLGLVVTSTLVWAARMNNAQPKRIEVLYDPYKPQYFYAKCVGPRIMKADRFGATWWRVSRCPSSKDEAAIFETRVPRWTGVWPRDWAAGDYDRRTVVGYGWPLRVAMAEVEGQPRRENEAHLRPIWLNLIASAALFAACFALPHQLQAMVRRLRRARRGLCKACGYDRRGLRSDAPCPECGHEARPDASAG